MANSGCASASPILATEEPRASLVTSANEAASRQTSFAGPSYPEGPGAPSRSSSSCGVSLTRGSMPTRPGSSRHGLAGLGDALDQIRGPDAARVLLEPLRNLGQLRLERLLPQQAVDRAGDVVVGERVGREALTEPRFVDALSVVVLVPEDRQQHHRLAMVHALGDRVVAAVRYDEVDVGEHRDLREELGADHVRRELVGLVLGTLRDHEAVRG